MPLPGLGFVERSLSYYEKFFGLEEPMPRFLHPDTSQAFGTLRWQLLENEDILDEIEWWTYTPAEVCDGLRAELELPDVWVAWGISLYDSLFRRSNVKHKIGAIDEEGNLTIEAGRQPKSLGFYPCFDWRKHQLMEMIDASGVKLPGDYLMARRSVNGVPMVEYMEPMMRLYPEDYARLEAAFPLIGCQWARNEFRKMAETRQRESIVKGFEDRIAPCAPIGTSLT
jgi:hypothetical protein